MRKEVIKKLNGKKGFFWAYEVKDKHNNTIIPLTVQRAHSWVGNMLKIIGAIAAGFGVTSSNNTGFLAQINTAPMVHFAGNTDSVRMSYISQGATIGALAPANDDTAGIQIGSSSVSTTIDMTKLQSQISNASGFQYGITNYEISLSGNSWYVHLWRQFNNTTNNNFGVGEFGLVVKIPAPVLIARDVPSQSVIVPGGSTITVDYVIAHQI